MDNIISFEECLKHREKLEEKGTFLKLLETRDDLISLKRKKRELEIIVKVEHLEKSLKDLETKRNSDKISKAIEDVLSIADPELLKEYRHTVKKLKKVEKIW